MAPRGHLHFHPKGNGYCDDFSTENIFRQGHFIHEMVHIWQAQVKGSWYLVLNRMPWAPYHYALKPGWPLEKYGIEQQAEIVKHAFWLRNGLKVAGVSDPSAYELLANFPGATGTKPA
ncbi:MAG: vgr related protein [Erythrobacter sp.]